MAGPLGDEVAESESPGVVRCFGTSGDGGLPRVSPECDSC